MTDPPGGGCGLDPGVQSPRPCCVLALRSLAGAVGGGRRCLCLLGSGVPAGFPLTLSFPVFQSTPSPSADLLGLGAAPPAPAGPPPSSGGLLVDVFSDSPSAVAPLAPGSEDNFAR